MKSREKEEKGLEAEAEDEKSVERGQGQGPDIGGTGRSGDDILEREIMRDGGERGIITAAAQRARKGDSGGEWVGVTLTVMTAELRGLRSQIQSSRKLFNQLLTR